MQSANICQKLNFSAWLSYLRAREPHKGTLNRQNMSQVLAHN